MKFDYTYIPFGSFLLYEPLIVVSNTIFLILGMIFFFRLWKIGPGYARQMGTFMLTLGVSSVFGAVGHSVHYQFGMTFFSSIVFLMHAFSLLSAYFCLRSTLSFYTYPGRAPRWVSPLMLVITGILLAFCLVLRKFLLVEIYAGLVLLFALIVYIGDMRRKAGGASRYIVWGIITAFLSIVVHLAGLSLHTWFNQKDLAHLFMIVSMALIFRGAYANAWRLKNQTTG